MLNEFLQGQAAMYAAGTMTTQEREQLELVFEFHHELRQLAVELAEIGASIVLSTQSPTDATPSPDIKARLSSLIAGRRQHSTPEGMVMSGPDGLVEWANPAFSAMCGYSLGELRGKEISPLLQGAGTDRQTAERMRRAVNDHSPCQETVLNHHKNGTPYWAEIAITPIFDDAGELLWLVVRERELTDRIVA